jgi:hypothetical protein
MGPRARVDNVKRKFLTLPRLELRPLGRPAPRLVPAATCCTFMITMGELCSVYGSHSSGYKEFCLLGHNAVYFFENQQIVLKSASPLSSRSR